MNMFWLLVGRYIATEILTKLEILTTVLLLCNSIVTLTNISALDQAMSSLAINVCKFSYWGWQNF